LLGLGRVPATPGNGWRCDASGALTDSSVCCIPSCPQHSFDCLIPWRITRGPFSKTAVGLLLPTPERPPLSAPIRQGLVLALTSCHRVGTPNRHRFNCPSPPPPGRLPGQSAGARHPRLQVVLPCQRKVCTGGDSNSPQFQTRNISVGTRLKRVVYDEAHLTITATYRRQMKRRAWPSFELWPFRLLSSLPRHHPSYETLCLTTSRPAKPSFMSHRSAAPRSHTLTPVTRSETCPGRCWPILPRSGQRCRTKARSCCFPLPRLCSWQRRACRCGQPALCFTEGSPRVMLTVGNLVRPCSCLSRHPLAFLREHKVYMQ
jgi:hypothetical protein